MARGMNSLQANICLLTVTICWSTEVVIFSVIPDGINPFATTCVTSLIGALLLIGCFARRIAAAFRQDGKLIARRIFALGALNTSYNVLFLVGLEYFDVSTGAFSLTMTAVILPVMLLVLHRGVSVRTWVSVACILLGIVVATAPTIKSSQVEGLLVLGVGCFLRAIFILKLNDYAREHDPLTLAAGMLSVNATLAFCPWFAMQPLTFFALPWSGELIASYFIYGYFVSAFTTALNILAQRRALPTQATIIYSTEIIFSTIWAVCLPASIVAPVELTAPLVIGCALIVVGNVVEVLPGGKQPEEDAQPAMETAREQLESPEANPAARSDSLSTSDLVTELLSRLKQPAARHIALFVILLVVYLVIALPFKVLGVIPGFSDVRPVYMLYPVYGIFFGLPGCFACAVGNLIGDIASDSLRWSSIAGFVANFIYPYLLYLFWAKVRKGAFHLRTGRAIALFAVGVAVCSCIQCLMIAPAVAYYYPEVDLALFAASVLANGFLFPIAFAIPFIVLIQEELGFVPLGSERTSALPQPYSQ